MTTSDTLRFSHSQSARYLVRRFSKNGVARVTDTVTREEPLEIRITYSFKDTRKTESVAVTMRTPGNDRELAAGFLFSEGVITRPEDLIEIRQLGGRSSNEVLAELDPVADVEPWRLRRATLLSSACGICGKQVMESIATEVASANHTFSVTPDLICSLPSVLLKNQTEFGQSGGLHAAALFTPDGEMLHIFEDIGRHNALDKVIGSQFLASKLPLHNQLLFMTSRGSFELVQKSLASRCAMLVTIGAPSTLAIDLAREHNMTLVGFVRGDHFNVYSGEWRVNA